MEMQSLTSLSLPKLRVEIPMREADQYGTAGQAWLIQPSRPEQEASLGTWLVNVPGAHQLWSWWVVAVVHLREEAHLPAPLKSYDAAEYEFTILTVDPEESPTPDPDRTEKEGLAFLLPADVVEQFHGVKDRDAQRIAAHAVSAIVEGRISPDADFRPRWKVLLEQTIADFKAGHFSVN